MENTTTQSNIFQSDSNQSPWNDNTEYERPGNSNGNNCHGHYTAISAGSNGHWDGDGCGCFGSGASLPIDFITVPLLLTAVVILLFLTRN